MTKTILVIGTFDTKADELAYLINRIKSQRGSVVAMDTRTGDAPARDASEPHASAPEDRHGRSGRHLRRV